jgi:hypothetical protein
VQAKVHCCIKVVTLIIFYLLSILFLQDKRKRGYTKGKPKGLGDASDNQIAINGVRLGQSFFVGNGPVDLDKLLFPMLLRKKVALNL